MARKKNVHVGHRERTKQKFIKYGLDSFEAHEVLELLLFFGIPQADTNPIAHELLNRFGDLHGVLSAPPEELKKIKGIGNHTSTLLKLSAALLERYYSEPTDKRTIFTTLDSIGAYLRPFFFNEPKEKIYLLTVNNRWELLGRTVLSSGTLTVCEARTREIVEIALSQQATGVVLAHNHPQGFAVPSKEDIEVTGHLYRSLHMMDIQLLDHLIFDSNDYVSLRQTPAFAPLFD